MWFAVALFLLCILLVFSCVVFCIVSYAGFSHLFPAPGWFRLVPMHMTGIWIESAWQPLLSLLGFLSYILRIDWCRLLHARIPHIASKYWRLDVSLWAESCHIRDRNPITIGKMPHSPWHRIQLWSPYRMPFTFWSLSTTTLRHSCYTAIYMLTENPGDASAPRILDNLPSIQTQLEYLGQGWVNFF